MTDRLTKAERDALRERHGRIREVGQLLDDLDAADAELARAIDDRKRSQDSGMAKLERIVELEQQLEQSATREAVLVEALQAAHNEDGVCSCLRGCALTSRPAAAQELLEKVRKWDELFGTAEKYNLKTPDEMFDYWAGVKLDLARTKQERDRLKAQRDALLWEYGEAPGCEDTLFCRFCVHQYPEHTGDCGAMEAIRTLE